MSKQTVPTLRSIVQLADDIRHGSSPVDILEGYLQRIEERNGVINAMVHVDSAGARAGAIEAEGEIRTGRYRGPLHGIPVAVKDVIDVAGWPTTGGSRLFGGHIAERDAACVANLRSAGAIIVGKTNMHEITAGNHDNPWFGKVVNPLDSSHGTGGTSSGSAAAVAAGFCAGAIGTDTGGSNRSVAAATGLVGYKPSNGLIAAGGVRPTAPSLDVIGPITLTVADARLVVQAMQGRAIAEVDSALQPARSELVLVTCPGLYADTLDPAVRQGISAWLLQLEATGVTVIERRFPQVQALVDAGLAILQYEFAAEYGPLVDAHPDKAGDAVHDFLGASRQLQASDYTDALEVRASLRSSFFALLADADALLVPTAPGLAPRLSDEMTLVGDQYVPYGPAGGRFRRWANVFGMPVIALPLPTSDIFGASMQLAGLPGQDADVLHIASSLPVRSLAAS